MPIPELDSRHAQPSADLLTIPQAAPLVHLHRDTLYRLARTGQFPPAIKVGAKWFVSRPRLERFLHGDSEAR